MPIRDRNMAFEDLRLSAVNRLRYMEFLIWFRGYVSRKDLIDQYKIAEAAATKDFKLYSDAYPENLTYDVRAKRYMLSEKFYAAFKHESRAALSALAGIGSHRPYTRSQLIESDVVRGVHRLNKPDIVAALTRAISLNSSIHCVYSSVGSGTKERQLAPRALASDGDRWHIRAFAPDKGEFRDYTLSRFQRVDLDGVGTAKVFDNEVDESWHTMIPIKLIAHPNADHPGSVEASFKIYDGLLELEVRCAMLGYFLRRWRIDVTDDAVMNPASYQLRLANVDEVRTSVERITDSKWPLESLVKEQIESHTA